MPPITYITGTDLTWWANHRNSQSNLPQLIRKLVRATIDNPSRVDFPSGDAVQLGGYDGIVITEHGNSFVPQGISAWELGVSKDPKGKADDDYEKRSKDPLGIDPTHATFIFVTPRRWGGKDEWVRTHQVEGRWREVRVYDADDIEQWLELAPSVHVWISILLGKHLDDAIDLSNYWDEWKNKTKYQIPPEFILAGRDDTKKSIEEWIQEPIQPLVLQADTREEALLVFTAVVQKLDDEAHERVSNRTLIIYDHASWRRIINTDDFAEKTTG